MTHNKITLDELDRLLEKSFSNLSLEKQINETINHEKRRMLVESLEKNMQLLKRAAVTEKKAYVLSLDSLLIETSFSNRMRRNGNPVGYIGTILSDKQLKQVIEKGGPANIQLFDNRGKRTCYFTEFEERYRLLVLGIMKGELDNLLNDDPWKILHYINGAFGEALPALGLPYGKSKTFDRLLAEFFPRLIIICLQDSTGKGINGAKVYYHQNRWRAITGFTGEHDVGDGFLYGILDEPLKPLRIKIINNDNVLETDIEPKDNHTYVFETKGLKVITQDYKTKPLTGVLVKTSQQSKIIRESYTDQSGETFFELFNGEYTIESEYQGSIQRREIHVIKQSKSLVITY